ncbi:hypothetical protein H721_01480 [Brucella ovis IntaBari-2006-46-332]|nr:hypothetical protein C010_01463 [Brucella ovis 80/125]ENR08064.1 hypothetical protein C961_01450 [Brucella ovis F8/05B]ENS94995.1 hypothetical protein B999_01789 [Brucella ovis 63/96]ENS99139.1 hypothetical protein C009_01474 [Brucella ovis 81/8]ENT78078.1 hypothetical protein H712_01454 [Brucella ovis IntaBari-2009-88-4]ENT80402.1 hypothetical protein H720_01462 [Brucella ovis IntaBari-2006-46-348]ENT83798.1 hypothetical protein H713_01458 [Brucella ovis IntaBari-2010-47-268]ENT88592.1 h
MEKGGGESLKLRSFVLTRIFSENRFTLFGMRSHAAYVTIRARNEAECRAIKTPAEAGGEICISYVNDQPVMVMFTALGPFPRRSGSVS